jgi:hypothetical protein
MACACNVTVMVVDKLRLWGEPQMLSTQEGLLLIQFTGERATIEISAIYYSRKRVERRNSCTPYPSCISFLRPDSDDREAERRVRELANTFHEVARRKQEATGKTSDADRKATAAGVMSSYLTKFYFSDISLEDAPSGSNGGQSGQQSTAGCQGGRCSRETD